MVELRPYQRTDYSLMVANQRFAVWDEAGLGKTRPILLAASEVGRPLVIAPAAVRDTRVWEREAERIGVEPPEVISYHQAIRGVPHSSVLILDEAHRLKERKTSWHEPIYAAAKRADAVYEATGTPMPNGAFELWGQLRMIRPFDEHGMKYYWPWVQKWFAPDPTEFDQYNMSDHLLGCYCSTEEQSQTCRHWQAFYDHNMAGYTVRHLRDDVLTDLPPLDGHEDPLLTPMVAGQRKAYQQLKKELLAVIPDAGIVIEALSDVHQFIQLQQLSSGLSVLDPAADPSHSESGKLTWLREYLRFVGKPVLVVVWWKNSARAVAAVCDELKIGWQAMGAKASPLQRARMVVDFGAGQVPVLIASLGVVKEGVDGLQYGSDEVVLFERSWVPGDNEQVVRRLHRLGQTRPVTARQLVTPRTVDWGQWSAVGKKGVHIRTVLRPAEVRKLVA